ncbi:peroxidase family protein [Roseomonas fluvialis]|uniref:Cyclolysin n=1 Tax=Roseomonas fluvialis TaxID=1750527 RepID=A0ABN6P8X4_9PROT|nr:peroxidase family protein [Roseomonas fluvialis]BDG74000.1 hypothetical protein Rmf_39290 [Roseomonas fluvialis]
MVTYIRSDLEFILDQIKIAEQHAAGAPLFGPGGLVPAYNVSFGLRTVDGTYNHLLPGQENWGASDVQFPALVDPSYAPGYTPSNNPASIVFDPSLRTISNLIVDQTLGNPAAILEALERGGVRAPTLDNVALVTTIYQAFKPASDAEYQARVALQNAEALANELSDPAPPGGELTPEQQTALDAAQAAVVVAAAAHAAALNDLEAARTVRDAALVPFGIAMDGDNVHLPNISPDVGLSASFNSWFTLFGQFFDHGLDLVNKGGSGTVFIPLQADDPLYVEGSDTNFMVLTRATVSAGTDGIMGTADDVGPVNTTTSYVDQNQTYTSHPSHQVFLREYVLNTDGQPVATGKLIEGLNGGMATWGEVKAQALAMLGITLTDQDVGSVPLLRTDQYGNFIPHPDTGFPQVITGVGLDGIPNTADDITISGTPGAPVTLDTAIRTNHAFLADIAHDAVPKGIDDGDVTIGLANPGNNPDVYDNELLDAHFMAGDGRVNENIGLTAVHHVFHSEHNRLVEHTKSVVLADAVAMLAGGASQAEAVAFLNEWLAVDVAVVPQGAAVNSLAWDGERLFQAAKFGTEMQYQHLVFEEFARKVQPQVDFFIVPDGFDTTINPDIVAEFAHVVYRFGHSMLTESIDRFDPSFNADHISLVDGFLNPAAFTTTNGVEDGLAAGDIIRGMTRQVGNEIDEFVTSALRNNLLGLPLDLATINLARGRDTGVPTLNEARREFYEATNNDSMLRPYESWIDFASNLKNEASIINFIAAYGTHTSITNETTLEGKRAAAMAIIFGEAQTVGVDDPNTPEDESRTFAVPGDAEDFLNGRGAHASTLGGLENVDLWIGGLAEKILPFGGMLGSTFNFVFEVQMEKLQNADRFYYLQRLDGLHLFGEMENNSFASMIMRNTDATHLPSDVFSTPGLILEVDQTRQWNPDLGTADPAGGTVLTPLVIRNNPATAGPDANYLRYTGDEHVVLGGTEGNDILTASEGDDAIYGDGGNDTIQGGAGNDIINAGAGDDIVRDVGGDDNMKLGDGNDVANTGPGLDLVMGGRGQDFIVLGNDAGTEVFAGEGNDFILGNLTAERILGNEGDDWIEYGTFDGAPGDNFDEIFARDGIRGNDVFFGLGGFDEFIGEGGDDVMVGSAGVGKMVGMSGFDWTIYKNNTAGTNADLFRLAFDETPIPPSNAALDVYDAVEGLSGSRFGDTLRGSDDTSAEIGQTLAAGGTHGYLGSALDAQGIALVTGLQAVVGAGVTLFDDGEILLGGDGSDIIEGRGGNDIIDGDKWFNVRISVRQNNDGTGPEIATADSMTQLVTRMFNATFNPGQLQIQREILTADGAGDIDVAVFSGARAEYTLGLDALGRRTVSHTGGTQADGVDTISNIEVLRFTDQDLDISNTAATGAPAISDTSPTEGQLLTASLGTVADANGGINAATVAYQWQHDAGGGFVNIAGANSATFVPTQLQVNGPLRVVVSFTDNSGYAEQRVSAPTIVVGDLFGAGNGAGNGVDTFNGTAGDDNASALGGNDRLFGNAGNDTLNGGNGNDTLDGGSGNDAMAGGAGSDTYFVDSLGDVIAPEGAGAGNGADDGVVTSLSAYTLATNIENLTYSGAGAFTGSGNNGANAILGGVGGDTLAGLSGNDALEGGGGDDSLDGGVGNDELVGGAGNDTLAGNAGNDTMEGGAGDDLYVVGSAGDVVFGEAIGGGTDTVRTNLATYTLGANVENLTRTGGGAFSGTGNALDNVIIGGSGANTLTGLAGHDTLSGMGGTDNLVGDDGNDVMSGGLGNDTLNGGAGNDSITGDGGVDRLTGGAGNDAMNGGAGNDIFIFGAGFGADTITGFDANPAGGQDLLDISGLGITAASFEASVTIAVDGAGMRVTIGLDSIFLAGVSGSVPNAITQADFILA